MIELLGTVLIVASAVMAVTFCVAYHLSARWWRSEEGRHLMSFTAVIAAVLILWTIGALTPAHGPWWLVLRLVAFSGVPIVLAWRLLMLYRLQIRPAFRRRK